MICASHYPEIAQNLHFYPTIHQANSAYSYLRHFLPKNYTSKKIKKKIDFSWEENQPEIAQNLHFYPTIHEANSAHLHLRHFCQRITILKKWENIFFLGNNWFLLRVNFSHSDISSSLSTKKTSALLAACLFNCGRRLSE